MIVYKWCIKKRNKYYPLVNYGIHPRIKRKSYPYEIGKIYSEFKDLIIAYNKSFKIKWTSFPRNPMNDKGFHNIRQGNPVACCGEELPASILFS